SPDHEPAERAVPSHVAIGGLDGLPLCFGALALDNAILLIDSRRAEITRDVECKRTPIDIELNFVGQCPARILSQVRVGTLEIDVDCERRARRKWVEVKRIQTHNFTNPWTRVTLSRCSGLIQKTVGWR